VSLASARLCAGFALPYAMGASREMVTRPPDRAAGHVESEDSTSWFSRIAPGHLAAIGQQPPRSGGQPCATAQATRRMPRRPAVSGEVPKERRQKASAMTGLEFVAPLVRPPRCWHHLLD
jgi:hypothetical protein